MLNRSALEFTQCTQGCDKVKGCDLGTKSSLGLDQCKLATSYTSMTYVALPCTVQSVEYISHQPGASPCTVHSPLYSTQVWSTSEALPSTIEISCTVHKPRTLRSDQKHK